MESVRGQGGIQMLLTAEQEAQQIISAARNLRATRLKQAKDESDQDVANFRNQMDADHQRKISETSGNSESTVKRLEEETNIKIKELKAKATAVSPDVTAMLIKHVTNVKC